MSGHTRCIRTRTRHGVREHCGAADGLHPSWCRCPLEPCAACRRAGQRARKAVSCEPSGLRSPAAVASSTAPTTPRPSKVAPPPEALPSAPAADVRPERLARLTRCQVAAESFVDERTVRRALSGQRVMPLVYETIRRALAARGLAHLLPARKD